jgi:hypothetical protein
MSFMDVTGGGPMSIGYNNALQQNQINQYNNSMANSQANNYAAIAAGNAYDPWSSGGGFGKQTADYSALGAAYGRQVPASSPAAVAAANAGYNYIDAGGSKCGKYLGVGDGGQDLWDDMGAGTYTPPPSPSFDDRWSNVPPQSSFADRWGSTAYTPQYQLPTMITGGAWGTGGSAPYTPPSGGGDPYGGIGKKDFMQFAGIVGQEAANLWAQQQQKASGLGGQPYGPGYFDNTFGSANAANQSSRDRVAAAWMAQNPYSGSGQMPSAVFGGSQAEAYWRDPFSYSRPGGSGNLAAGGIYQDPFGGFYPGAEVARNGVSGRPLPDYQYSGFNYDEIPNYGPYNPSSPFDQNTPSGG